MPDNIATVAMSISPLGNLYVTKCKIVSNVCYLIKYQEFLRRPKIGNWRDIEMHINIIDFLNKQFSEGFELIIGYKTIPTFFTCKILFIDDLWRHV